MLLTLLLWLQTGTPYHAVVRLACIVKCVCPAACRHLFTSLYYRHLNLSMPSPSSIRTDISLHFPGQASAPVSALLLLHGCQQSGIEAGIGGRLSWIGLSMALRAICGSLRCSLVPAHLPRPLARRGWRRLFASPCAAVNTLVHAPKSKDLIRSTSHARLELYIAEKPGPEPAVTGSERRRFGLTESFRLAPCSPLIAVNRQHSGHAAGIVDSHG